MRLYSCFLLLHGLSSPHVLSAFLLSTVLVSVKFASANLIKARGLESRAADPCTVIGNQSPADVRACYKSYPLNETVWANVSPCCESFAAPLYERICSGL